MVQFHQAALVYWVVALLCFSTFPVVRGQCPDVCACTGATDTVDCTGAGLDAVPSDVAPDTKILIMTSNNLSHLAPGSFAVYGELEMLILDDNFLTTIPLDVLDNNLTKLTHLSLDGNPFSSISDGVFDNLAPLEELTIERTPLTTLAAGVFQGLTALKTLEMDENQFSELPPDLLIHIPQIEFLSLTGNQLMGLPDGIFANATELTHLDLRDNPWSCDCYLGWIGPFLQANPGVLFADEETVCLWPPSHRNTPISSVPSNESNCYATTLLEGPQNTTTLSERTLTLTCLIDGAPFPNVTWLKDDGVLEYSDRVRLELFNASLVFEDVLLEDAGEYQCRASDEEGSLVESGIATLIVNEVTCFDGVLSSHETDTDCGGIFCIPCNESQSCLLDGDCAGDLVCLYTHQLLSQLHYISPQNDMAYTCAQPAVPSQLLQELALSSLSIGAAGTSLLVEQLLGINYTHFALNMSQVQSTLHSLLAEQLEVPTTAISSVQVTTVERLSKPLLQVWVEIPKTKGGEEAHSNVVRQVDGGQLRATVRVTEDYSRYRVRMNF